MPLSTERHAYLQKRSDEAKQQREDQWVIADAIRNGVFNPPPAHSANIAQPKPSTKPKAQTQPPKGSRRDNLAIYLETAIEECIGKNCNGISELTSLVMLYLIASIGSPGSPVVDEKDGAIVFEDKEGQMHEENFEALKKRVQRKFKTNAGMLEYKRDMKRTLSGRKDATG